MLSRLSDFQKRRAMKYLLSLIKVRSDYLIKTWGEPRPVTVETELDQLATSKRFLEEEVKELNHKEYKDALG